MTDANPFLASINSGEFSPRMEARVDFAAYPNAAKICRNLLLLPQGGITRRPGTRFIKEVKDSTVAAKIFPFQSSETAAYQVEAGNAYFRFYKRQARLASADIQTTIANGTFTGAATSWTLSGATYNSNAVRFATSVDTATQTVTVNAADKGVELQLQFQFLGIPSGTPGVGTMTVTVTSSGGSVPLNVTVGVGYHCLSFTTHASDATFDLKFASTFPVVTGPILALDNVSLLDNVPVEITTPYATADLSALRIFQAGDVAYLLHASYQPRRLERRGDKSWSLVEVLFSDGPYLATNDVGTGVTFDYLSRQLVANPFFDNGNISWTDSSTGDGHIFHTSNGAELSDGTAAGVGVAILRTTFDGSNDGSAFVIQSYILNQAVTFHVGTAAGGTTLANTTLNPGWTSTSISSTAATIHIEYTISGHTTERTGVAACLAYGDSARLLSVAATTGSTTLTATGFTPFASTDVGRLVRLTHPGYEPGYGVITAYSSTSSVTLLILRAIGSTVYTPDWALGSFGTTEGFPTKLGFFDGRLITANTSYQPQTIWASQSNDLENMRPDSFSNAAVTVVDTDAINVTLASKRIDPILWLGEINNLVLGTAGAQWTVSSIGGVITPSDIFAKINSAIPCADLELVQVSQSIIFADKSKRELYEMAFSTEGSGYIPELLTILADHIFNSPCAKLTYQRRPNSTLWCPRDDGRVATMAYNRAHQVLGWSQQILGGVFSTGDAVVEDVSIIPGASDANQVNNSDERDEVWLLVKRTINGSTKRYIEVVEKEFVGPLREDYTTEALWWAAMRTSQKNAFYVDCGITYNSSSTATITGLSHLEGQTVKIWADGKDQADKTVASGQITLDTAASIVQVGLGYTHRYMSLKLAAGAQSGSAVGKVKAITGCSVVVVDTGTFDLSVADQDEQQGRVIHDLYTFDFRRNLMTDMTVAVPLFSGESYKSLDSNFSTDPRLYIEGDEPCPFTLIGLAPLIDGTDAP